jgi:hypothetical protein
MNLVGSTDLNYNEYPIGVIPWADAANNRYAWVRHRRRPWFERPTDTRFVPDWFTDTTRMGGGAKK